MQITQHHGTYNRSKRNGAIQYLVIHYTGGTGSALNNCKYFAGGNRNASADYFVDDNGIWEYNDPGEGYYTWAVGDGRGKYGITNSNSISVEVVNNGGAYTQTEINYLKELVPYLLQRFNIPANRVVRHWDASRKMCPYYYAANPTEWENLKAVITSGQGNVDVVSPAGSASAGSVGLAVDGFWGPATQNALAKLFGTPADGVMSGQFNDGKKPGVVCAQYGKGGSTLVRALQRWLGVSADGLLGKNTITALQKRMGTTQDGVLSRAGWCVKEMQRRLNAGNFK